MTPLPVEQARNITKHQNMPISIGHYLNNMSKLADQWNRENYKDLDRQRIYLKDIDCPTIWHDKLKERIPQSVFYLNESTGELGGPGSSNDHEQGAARAGDLMSCLPPAMRAENMMCYIGHEGTYTPAHREMCASLGHNLMVETSRDKREDGKPTKPGSSIWFMTETNDRHLVSEYWLSTLGHDIEVESHFAQVNAWKAAPFTTYIVDQKVGDFILIPPLAPHQVWNRGTRTMKAAWNRTTVETLEMALHEALPRARMVCRDEQYKNKAIIYFSLEQYSGRLKQVQSQKDSSSPEARYEIGHSLKIRQLQKDFKRLFALYTEILLSEMLDPVSKTEKRGQYLPFDSFITCSYCRCNIFNRFLTCTSCVAPLENGDEDTYDICLDCYAMGRSCSCLSKYKWVEQFPWKELVDKHDAWRHLIIDFEGGVNEKSPLSLESESKALSKKPLAQVCQEQLKARPFVDPKKPGSVGSTYDRRHPGSALSAKDREEQEVNVDDWGNVKKAHLRKTRAEKLPKGWVIEHVSCYPEVQWKVATCTKCDRHYSYGSLFRMFDLMPQTAMENPEWTCPVCLKICSCGACRKKGDTQPHEPRGTVLGHDTKKVADPRSVESLVNFSLPNLGWIKRLGDDHPHESRRLSRRIDEAERAKAKDPALDENFLDEGEYAPSAAIIPQDPEIISSTEQELPIDPTLLMDQPITQSSGKASNQSGHTEVPIHMNGIEKPREPHREPDHNLAPIANMTSQNNQMQGFTSNGIAYEYPDPTMTQSTSTFKGHQFGEPNNGTSGARQTNILESDATVSPQKANDKQQLTQLERMLEDAKLNDHYISIEAKLTEKSLPITLSIHKSKLAEIVSRPPVPHLMKPAADCVKNAAPVILQSDFPLATHAAQPSASRKRKPKSDNDADFNSRKRKDRKSLTNPTPAKDTRKKAVKYTELSSDSEMEDLSSFLPVDKPQGPRRLPKYIAQRTHVENTSAVNESSAQRLSPTQQLTNTPQTSMSGDQNREDRPDSSMRPPRSVSFAATKKTPSDPSSASKASIEPDADGDILMSENMEQMTKSDSVVNPTFANRNVHANGSSVPSPQAAAPKIDPAQKLAEDNRKAKMRASQWKGPDDGSSSDSTIKSSKAVPRSLSAGTSIFSQPGPNGKRKKIKIVGAKPASVNGKAAQRAMNIARRSLGAL